MLQLMLMILLSWHNFKNQI